MSAAAFALEIGAPLLFKPHPNPYVHGWGQAMANAKQAIATWEVELLDLNDNEFRLKFDIVDGDEPLVIGDNILKFSNHIRLSDKPSLVIKTPSMDKEIEFASYSNPGEDRPRLFIVPPEGNSKSSMIGKASREKAAIKSADLLVRKIHGYSHDTAHDMRRLLKLSNKYNPFVEAAIKKVISSCGICVQSGRPLPSKKVSIKHIDKDFNNTVFVDFFYAEHGVPQKTYMFLHARCASTGYSEVSHVSSRDMKVAAATFDSIWISTHGAPKCVGGDPEFDKAPFTKLLNQHSIRWEPRPARRHNQVGVVERKNQVLKNIMLRLSLADPNMGLNSLAARANFLSNVFAGSRIASSFEMARGYTPGISGLCHLKVSSELVQAQKARTARRALQRLLSSHKSTPICKSLLPSGRKIWFFDKDRKWHEIQVRSTEPYFVTCRRKKKGPALKIAYEDIRLAPDNSVDYQLLSSELGGVSEDVEEMDVEPNDDSGAVETTVDSSATTQAEKDALLGATGDPVPQEKPCKDIGNAQVSDSVTLGPLRSDKDLELAKVYEVIGHATVMRRDLEFAPPWLIDEAYNEEEKNWDGVYQSVEEVSVPRDANVISSHVAYKIKVTEHDKLRLKARICPLGNLDKDKDGIRKDSAAAQFPTIRLMLSLSALLGLKVGTIDISAAYLQSGPIKREIFVHPPKEHRGERGRIWKLLKLPYGIAEAGRQWQTTCEAWLLSKSVGFKRVDGVTQLFVLHHKNGNVRMLCAKVTDDFLFSGCANDLKWFDRLIRQRFKVGKTILEGNMNFNGAVVQQDASGNITLSMEAYMERAEPIPLERDRRKNQESPLTPEELKQYRGLAGVLNWAGRAAIPVGCYAASDMQQKLGLVRVKHICSANGMLAEIQKLNPVVLYKHPRKTVTRIFIPSFSDASFNVSPARSYGQSGFVTGIAYLQEGSNSLEYHVCDWNSNKQRRVSHSSYGAEILAAADGDDRTYNFRQSLRSLFKQTRMQPIRSALYVDSKALYDTSTTTHDATEYRLRQTVQRIRDSFESSELDALVWIPGPSNVADALTKRNVDLQLKLDRMCNTGMFAELPEQCCVDSESWF